MNYKLMAMAFEANAESSTELMLMIALAKFANINGECFPSYEVLARTTKLSKRTIITTVNKLVAKGLISLTARFNKQNTKERTSNLIALHYEKFIHSFNETPLNHSIKNTYSIGGEMISSGGETVAPPSETIALGSEINGQGGCNKPSEVVKQLHPNIYNKYTNEVIYTTPAQTSSEMPIGLDWVPSQVSSENQSLINQPISNQPTTIEYLVSDEDKNKPVQSNPSLKENYQAYFKQKETKIELIKKELIQLDVNAHEAETFAKRLIESNKFKRGFQTALDNLIANIKAGVNKEISANRIVVVANERNWHDYQASWGVYPERSNHAKSYKDYDPSAHAKQDPDYYTNANFAHVKVVGGNGKLFDR